MYTFPVEENEKIIFKGEANMAKTGAGEVYHGALYLTTERLVFIGYLMEIENKYMEEISLHHISEVKPEKTFYLFPNKIAVKTIRDVEVKFIVKNQKEWLGEIEKMLP